MNISYYGKLLLGEDCIMYLNKINKSKITLLYKEITSESFNSMYFYRNEYLILNRIIDDFTTSREIYDAFTGKYKNTFIDTLIDKNTFTRKKGNLVLTTRDSIVIHVNASKNLSIIKYIPKGYSDSANPFIGSLDLETYTDSDGTAKIYALGFIVSGDHKEFYRKISISPHITSFANNTKRRFF